MAKGSEVSPWAADPVRARRRHPTEDHGRSILYRSPFERDRDRILHARAFRRLAGKTQLLPVSEGRQVRTRLTHSLEIASAARTLARHLGLGEDLAEAIALGHDLGTPPFGASGARTLDQILGQGLGRRVPGGAALGGIGGFSIAQQTLRIVDLLEVRYDHAGLNLTDATREGLLKLHDPTAAPGVGIDPTGLQVGLAPPVEAECVRAALRLVTPLHDLEDALAEGLVELRDLLRLGPVARLVARLRDGGGWPRGGFRQRAALHRALVHATISDVLVHSQRRLATPPAGARAASDDPIVGPSRVGLELIETIQHWLGHRVLASPATRRADARGSRIVDGLFVTLYRDPLLLDDAVLLRFKEISRRPFLRDLPPAKQAAEIASHLHGRPAFARLLADHIAGMTDRHAEELWQSLLPGRSAR